MTVASKVKASLVAAATVGLALAATPANALAAPKAGAETATGTSATTAAASRCLFGRVESIANNLPIRRWASHSAPVITWAQKGYQYNCNQFDPYTLGDRYTACGVSNANGWLWISFNDGSSGVAYMTCLKDV